MKKYCVYWLQNVKFVFVTVTNCLWQVLHACTLDTCMHTRYLHIWLCLQGVYSSVMQLSFGWVLFDWLIFFLIWGFVLSFPLLYKYLTTSHTFVSSTCMQQPSIANCLSWAGLNHRCCTCIHTPIYTCNLHKWKGQFVPSHRYYSTLLVCACTQKSPQNGQKSLCTTGLWYVKTDSSQNHNLSSS